MFVEHSLDDEVKLILFFVFQIAYLAYVVITRPFVRVKDNIGELLNEVFYVFFLAVLIYMFGDDDWSYTTTWVFMISIMTNNGLFVVISICKRFVIYRLV